MGFKAVNVIQHYTIPISRDINSQTQIHSQHSDPLNAPKVNIWCEEESGHGALAAAHGHAPLDLIDNTFHTMSPEHTEQLIAWPSIHDARQMFVNATSCLI